MFQIALNNRGQSLVGVMVASAIAIGSMMAVLSLLKYSSKGQRAVQSMADKTELERTLDMILGNSALCKNAFWDGETKSGPQIAYFKPDPPSSTIPMPTPLPGEKLPASVHYGSSVVIAVGTKLNSGATVTGIGLGEADPASRVVGAKTTVYAAALSVFLDQDKKNGKDANGNPVFAAPDLQLPLYVETDNNTHQLVNCGSSLTPAIASTTPAPPAPVGGSGSVIQVAYSQQAKPYVYGAQNYSPSGLGITYTPKSLSSVLLVECNFSATSPLGPANTFAAFQMQETTALPSPTPDPKTHKTPKATYPVLQTSTLFCATSPVNCYAGAPSTMRAITANTALTPRSFVIYVAASAGAGVSYNGSLSNGLCTVTEITN